MAAAALAALAVLAPGLQAGTTAVNVQLGASFTGTIGTPGVDTVQASFSAAQGATVRIRIQANSGTGLQPMASLMGPSGPVALSASQRIAWLPVANLIHYFTAPETGTYVLTIGASAGSGGFWANLSRTGGASAPTAGESAVSGTVTNALTDAAIAGASVLVDGSPFATTNASGAYSGSLAAGDYSVTFQASGFEDETEALHVVAGTPAVLDAELTPTVAVEVTAGVSGDAMPGGELTGSTDVDAPPGTAIDSYQWTQVSGVPVAITGATTATPTITLGDTMDYKDELLHVLAEPPITAEQLPPNVPLPEGEFVGGLQQDRLQVVGVNPFALEEAALVVLEVEVETGLGTFTDEVEIHADLPWGVSLGLANVPIGSPVLLYAPEQGGYSWTVDSPPGSSVETLEDATTRSPYFTPDVTGVYELELSGGPTLGVGEPLTIDVYAGTWRGVIVDQDIDGRPVPDTACTLCHDGDDAADKFTPWVQTGHAEIFTDNLDTSTHYSQSCFSCHTVGFGTEASDGGVDEADDWDDFLGAGLLNNPGDNWTTVLEDFPETARLANIQCENCHGPQDPGPAHGIFAPLGEPRVSLSSDVCASCHGEPLRHARFQQWQLSGHANYELAIDEGTSGSCARCHSANGFLKWLPILLGDEEGDPLDDIEVTWTEDEVHPQTCATCHDPHAEGTTTGVGSNATVRISGDTPPLIAGFTATDVGRGAICMTCHNSRRGLYNDEVYGDLSASDRTRAPHGSTQTDVLMGQNAFLVEVGDRGGHAFVDDACVGCHMEATPPPDLLAYNLGGTNHTFYAAPTICGECHSPHLTAADVQDGTEHLLEQVKDLIEGAAIELMDALIQGGNTIDVGAPAPISDVNEIMAIEFGESRGRQAFTITVASGTYGPTSVASIDVEPAGGTLYDYADDALIKAGWNYALVHNDGSLGVHNPFFTSGALIAARDALVAIPGVAKYSVSKEPAASESRILLRENRRQGRADRSDDVRATRENRQGR